jgi:flavin-dependent dehydrogenase
VWLFPKSKNLANIGFGALNVKNPREVLRRLLDSLGIKARQKSEYSGLINISGPIERTYSSRLLVAGTAAGLVFAGTGEGIRYALLSGKMAGETVCRALQKDDFSETQMASYEHEWKQLFGDAMQGGIVFRDLLFLGFKMKALELLFQQPSEEELRQMILAGKVPKRAALAWKTMDTLGRFRHRNPQQSKDF